MNKLLRDRLQKIADQDNGEDIYLDGKDLWPFDSWTPEDAYHQGVSDATNRIPREARATLFAEEITQHMGATLPRTERSEG